MNVGRNPLLWCALLALFGSEPAFAKNAATISLAGTWRLQLDRGNAGLQEKWFDHPLTGKIKLPGSLPAQGIGDDISVDSKWTGDIVDKTWFTAPEYAKYREPGHVKVPFWLQPDKYYAGVAWYQRDIDVPAGWRGKRLVLVLERPHWETRVWLDGREIGSNNSLSTPHEYDCGTEVSQGKHVLTIRVDNSLVVDIGVNSHSVTDHTQGNWNGIVGDISLRAMEPIWIEDLQVYPHVVTKSVTVKGRLGKPAGQKGGGEIEFVCERLDQAGSRVVLQKTVEPSWDARGFEQELQLGADAELWDEFNPVRYRLTAFLRTLLPGPLPASGERELLLHRAPQSPSPPQEERAGERRALSVGTHGSASRTVVFGLREISTQGTQFVLNGHKVFIRGTLECCIFPKTGHPPTDVDSWKRIIRVAKAYGLNLLRFHSWCPPEAAFVAADELGFYYQVEIASWANQSTTLGDGKPVDQWLYGEAEKILKAYGNHPSFLLMPYGNEPGGHRAGEYLAKWVEHWKLADPRRLYTSGSGWPQIPENQFHVTPDPRIQSWGGGLSSRINAAPPETRTDYREYIRQRSVPVISHEIGQWCVYPNFDEIPKYTGYLKPKNFEIFRDSLNEHHMGDLAHKFLLASGKLQTLCYKEEIESALRTPGMGGFELLDLHDFPGQGTALVGVLDPFWEDKGYVTAKEYSRFCNATVPLARLSKRVFTTDETLEADLEVAHFGGAAMHNARPTWRLINQRGKAVASGSLPERDVPLDNGIQLGHIAASLRDLPAPAEYKLVVSIDREAATQSADKVTHGNAQASHFENDWDVWVYPPAKETHSSGLLVVNELNDTAVETLHAGGKVLLDIPDNRVKGDSKGKVALGFSSIFWNTAWTHGQPPHTLGILCDPANPALAEFPTEYHSNWQWWYLIHGAGAMLLDDLPPNLRPMVQVVDDWVTNRKLALLFEAKVGGGKLLVTSMDLLGENPVARQMRRSLLDYMGGPKFSPAVGLTVEQVRGLMAEPSLMQKLGARVLKCDSAQHGYEPEQALDGNPATMWHTSWEEPAPGFPHELQIEFPKPLLLRGFSVLPRQDRKRNGWIKDYAFYVSDDGVNWGEPVAKGTFAADDKVKRVTLSASIQARFVRLVALSGYADGPWASLAEFEVIL